MQHLRLVGVHEDGERLLLSGTDGEHYTLPLDDALRAAARRDRPRLGQLQIEMNGGMRPREVQSLVRSGLTADEISARSGWSVEKVRKFEAPIVAERVHVAELARGVRVRGRGGSSAGAPTLQMRVGQRMRDRGVDPDATTWDAWRSPEDAHWTVGLGFAAGGRQRQATWTFDLMLRTVEPADDEARWLSAEEASPAGPLPSAAVRATDVYDVEAEGGVAAARSSSDPVDLMTAMRQRTTVGRRAGRRRAGGVEVSRREAAAALPLESIAEPADAEPPDAEPANAEPANATEPEAPVVEVVEPAGSEVLPVEAAESDEFDEPPHEEPQVDETLTDAEPSSAPVTEPVPTTAKPARPAARKRTARTSVPSWDDIMFGAKRD